MASELSYEVEAFFPRAGVAQDGWSIKEEATAICYCGAVQLVFVSSLLKSLSHSLIGISL